MRTNALSSKDLPTCLQAPAGCPPGAEPWAHEGGRVGVLILHGFTGSPWEMRPLAEALVGEGLTIAMPVLAGHASTVQDLDQTAWRDWLASAREALEWLDARCDRVHLVGLSMGALLAVLLAHQRPVARTGAVVLLAPALALARWQRLVVLGLARLGWPAWLGKADPRLPDGVRAPGHQALPLRATRSFLELTEVVRGCAGTPPMPLLGLHGTRDLTIPHMLAERRARELFRAHVTWERVPGAGHLLLRDGCGSDVIARVQAFLQACPPTR